MRGMRFAAFSGAQRHHMTSPIGLNSVELMRFRASRMHIVRSTARYCGSGCMSSSFSWNVTCTAIFSAFGLLYGMEMAMNSAFLAYLDAKKSTEASRRLVPLTLRRRLQWRFIQAA